MKSFFSCLIAFLLINSTFSQINPTTIDIVRDKWGVPHIFAPTDAAASYGLAWAHAEDDFSSLQMVALPAKGLMGRVLGKEGASGDYAFALFRCREITEEKWHTLSPQFIAIAEAYVQALNDYAKKHPNEVLHKKLFPMTAKDYIASSVLALTVFNGADKVLRSIFANRMPTLQEIEDKGSNAIAVHPKKTNTGEAFLVINAHQPNTGPQAFYEAHLYSDEGLNILGGLLAGGPTVLHGVNEHLGWAHTVNLVDRVDQYQLKMHPTKKNHYELDGKWLKLEKKKVKLRIKGIPISVGRNVYWSEYGATMKNKQGFFSIRLGANMKIGALEQWYHMGKAKNFTEFYEVLKKQELSMFNIMYADKYDTIFYVNNGLIPIRDSASKYNWRRTLPGNTSATLWTNFRKLQDLPQYINPNPGFLYNTNHSSFQATAKGFNLSPKNYPKQDGWEININNRSERFVELMPKEGVISMNQLKSIKFDIQLPEKLQYWYGIDSMFLMEPDSEPQFAALIKTFKAWNKRGDANSEGAAIFFLTYRFVSNLMDGQDARKLTMSECKATYQYVLDHMMKHFNRTNITLGDLQKLVRGDRDWPLDGFQDLLAPQWTAPYKDGIFKSTGGDGYIVFARFPKAGLPILETVNMYGASAKPSSQHFADQVPLYLEKKTKAMTLDKATVYKEAVKVYHPQ